MKELRSIIGHGQDDNDGFRWYIVSDLNPKTGKQMRSGQKVAESLSCTCADFRNTQKECIHILSVRNFEEDIRTKPREELNAQKAEEIEALRRRIEELESEKNRYRGEKESRDKEIQNLKLELEDKEDAVQETNIQKAEEIEALRSKIDELESKSDRDSGEKESRDKEIQNLKLELKDKESEVQQINKIMEEKEAERQKAVSIAEMLSRKKFASLYKLSKEIQSYILGLAELEPEKIKEAIIPVVGPVIYGKIPRSETECRDKVIWGKREHHRPRRFEEFAQKIAEIDTIDQITVSREVRTNDTHIKGIYGPGRSLPYGQKNDGWTIHMVYSGSDFGVNLYLRTMARNDLEAELIRGTVENKI
jgi:DNA repair exonuclease SbcCD ATPase subunit